MNKYRRIKYEDRCQIYALSKRGSSQESIAEVLGVSQSAVSREMQRNRGQRGYRFKQAEAKSQARQAIRSKARKLTALMRCKIEAKLRQERWSPEQISGWLSEQGIKLSHERIYQMIWDDKRDGGNLWRSLRRRGKRYNKRAGKNAGRGLIPNRIDISERPAIVARKTRLGDWEGDTVVSAGHKGGLLTLVERKTQLAKITKLPRATARATQKAAVRRLKPIGDFVHTITFDNGKEFAAHQDIAHALKTKIFFATPYHAWERCVHRQHSWDKLGRLKKGVFLAHRSVHRSEDETAFQFGEGYGREGRQGHPPGDTQAVFGGGKDPDRFGRPARRGQHRRAVPPRGYRAEPVLSLVEGLPGGWQEAPGR